MTAAHDALDVAEYILDKRGAMYPFALQSLLYFCQGWHMVNFDVPLFEDKIEAWISGPTTRSVFVAHNGRWLVAPGDVKNNPIELPQRSQWLIDEVLVAYSELDSTQLRELSRSERPWLAARDGLTNMQPSRSALDLSEMREYFAEVHRSANP